jgi:hypothetical protein
MAVTFIQASAMKRDNDGNASLTKQFLLETLNPAPILHKIRLIKRVCMEVYLSKSVRLTQTKKLSAPFVCQNMMREITWFASPVAMSTMKSV